MSRLNSGIFWSFDLIKLKSNMTSSDCRASKIIWNDTKLEPISWEQNAGNPLFIVCVGVWVGGHPLTNFSHRPKEWFSERKKAHAYGFHSRNFKKKRSQFQNRIFRELDQNFYTLKISSNFWKRINAYIKSYSDFESQNLT